MTLVGTPLSTLDYVTATAVASPTAETAIITTDVVNAGTYLPPVPGSGIAPTVQRPVKVTVSLNITEGTTGTAFVVRCRQGAGTGGTQVGPALTVTLAAAASGEFTFTFRDTTGVAAAAAGTAYTITVAQTGATVAGTVNSIDVEVMQ